MTQYETLTIILTVVAMIELTGFGFLIGYIHGLKKGFIIGMRKEK